MPKQLIVAFLLGGLFVGTPWRSEAQPQTEQPRSFEDQEPSSDVANPPPEYEAEAVHVNAEKVEPKAIESQIPPAKSPTLKPPEKTSEPATMTQESKLVKSIEVKGNKTIGIATILSKIKIRVGDEYVQNIISDDLKRLYNTGYFSDVSIDRKEFEGGFKVIIYLTEKPIVEKISFSKLRHYSSRALLNKMKTKEGKFLDNKILKDDTKTIEELYAKKGLTQAQVKVETSLEEETNKAKLHFVINEGYRVQIKRIEIHGNKTFVDKRILKTIKTRANSFFTSGFLKGDLLQEDMERIESFYEKEGFIDVKATYEIKELGKGKIAVIINIEEGSRYYVGNLAVSGNKIATEDEILGAMKEIKVGRVFSREKLDVDLQEIRTLYFDKGYIFADVKESSSLSPQTGKVDIGLNIDEGQLAYVNKVKIQGNTRTRDIVIRREIRLLPGDRFDGAKLRRSKERLKNLGYFEDVNYDIEDTTQPNKKDLVVQVKEAKTGTLSFGGGYSTIDQLIGFVEIEQKNFDFTNWPTFTGGGQNLLLRAETGSFRNNMRLSFTEPWVFDYPVSGGFDAYRTERNRERDVGYGYDETRTGGDIRFGKDLTEYIKAGTSYKREVVKIDNLDTGATADLQKEVGTNTVSSFGFNVNRDTRDSEYNPSKGLYLGASTDLAGKFFGGDKEFYRLQNNASYDIPLAWDSVLELRGRVGIVEAYGDSDAVPIFERFFVGGARTIRGYNERRVGPIDPVTEDPIGGESMLVGNLEYTIPLIEFIKLAAFFDTGNVWSKVRDLGTDEFKSGAGLGLRVKTPIGPINLDYGYPLNDEPGEEERSGKFYFSVSRGF